MATVYYQEVVAVRDGREKRYRIPFSPAVSPEEIMYLDGLETNVQEKFDELDTAVSALLNALETPTGDVDGENDTFTFTKAPIVVYRNGVNETRLGTIDGMDFIFDTPPETGDDIEGLV